MPFKYQLTLLLTLIFSIRLYSQNITTDTIFIDFTPDSLIPVNFCFKNITDNRKINEKALGYSQKKKYILIPVEQAICLNKPLNKSLLTKSGTSCKNELNLEIDQFHIEHYDGFLLKQHILIANFPVYKCSTDSSQFLGTLAYNFEHQPRNKKASQTAVYEELLPLWHQQFKLDMLQVSTFAQTGNDKPENLLTQEFKRPKYFNIITSGVISIDFWQLDGEIYFSRPETNSTHWFLSKMVRYQSASDFELFAMGRKAEHYYKRFNENWNFDINSNFLIGFVKWRNPDEIKLYQLLQLSLSSYQNIVYEPLNRNGLIFKFGVFENMYYMVEYPLGFQLGLSLSCGYKF
ncbi:MAG: hypothetical protein JXB49_31000 [Bacteroidales bacterium]|nr:hypothetical protein [Bacteroidales bacterium]MBN2820732.1 hypothetical protein [Bacteroidales bacterium]